MKGSVRKRGEIWYYRINLGVINNKRKEIERAVGKSEKDAYKAMRQAMVELDQSGQYFEPSCKAFSDYLDEWIESYELNLKEYSIIKYKSIIEKHLKPSLGKYKLKSLSPALIQKFIDDKKRSGYSKNTTTLIFAVLRKSLRHAIHPFNYIKNNPAENIQLPKFDIRKKVTSFTPEQMQIIFKRFDSSHLFYIPIMIAYYTGMRLGECLALQWKNIDINSRKIAIDSTLYDKEKDKIRIVKAKTQTSIREIDFTDKLLNILKLQKKHQTEYKLKFGQFYEKNNFVCTHNNGRVITSNDMRYFAKWCKESFGENCSLSFHSLRHTHATVLLENNADIKYISTRLGHSSIKITLDTYAHVTQRMKYANMQIIEKSFL